MKAPALFPRVLPWAWQALAVLATALCFSGAALAQAESFMLQRGSNVSPDTRVKPTNCVTAQDGSVTCDTVIENPPGNTPAKPIYLPFKN